MPDEDSEEFKTALWNKVTMISQIMSSGHGIKTYYKPTPYPCLMWNLILWFGYLHTAVKLISVNINFPHLKDCYVLSFVKLNMSFFNGI